MLKFEWNPADLLLQSIFEVKSLPLGVMASQEASAHLEGVLTGFQPLGSFHQPVALGKRLSLGTVLPEQVRWGFTAEAPVAVKFFRRLGDAAAFSLHL